MTDTLVRDAFDNVTVKAIFDVPELPSTKPASEIVRLGNKLARSRDAAKVWDLRWNSDIAPVTNSAGRAGMPLPRPPCGVWNVTTLGAMDVAVAVAATDDAGVSRDRRACAVASTVGTGGAGTAEGGDDAAAEPVSLAARRVESNSGATILSRGI